MSINALDNLDLEEIDNMNFDNPQWFRIQNIEDANWAMRKLRAINKKQHENESLAASEIQRIESWLKNENGALEHSKQFFESLLTEHLMEQRKHDPKFKIKTPYGKVTTRKQQPEYKRDEQKMIDWAYEHDRADVVKVEESIDWATLKKDTTIKDGDVVDNLTDTIISGIKAIERPDKVVVEVDTYE